MKILITGASGFVGSFLLKHLIERKKNEIAILLRNPAEAWRIASSLKNVKVIQGSLDNSSTYRSSLVEFEPEVIAHLAWGGVNNTNRNVTNQWRNVSEMLELMEIANSANVHTFVGLGSQAEYGPINARVDETAATNPTTLYGASKLAACNLGQALAKAFDMRFAWLRLFSSYGPMDRPEWLLPYLINNFLKGVSPKVTTAEQLWDYIHVEDVASAIVSVIETTSAQGVFNLGSGQAVLLRSIIEKTRNLINPTIEIQFGAIPYRTDQVMHLEANINSLKNATGWVPRVKIEEGLAETINWWRTIA